MSTVVIDEYRWIFNLYIYLCIWIYTYIWRGPGWKPHPPQRHEHSCRHTFTALSRRWSLVILLSIWWLLLLLLSLLLLVLLVLLLLLLLLLSWIVFTVLSLFFSSFYGWWQIAKTTFRRFGISKQFSQYFQCIIVEIPWFGTSLSTQFWGVPHVRPLSYCGWEKEPCLDFEVY